MAVKEILDKRVIDLDMNAKTKDEVIRHLAGKAQSRVLEIQQDHVIRLQALRFVNR